MVSQEKVNFYKENGYLTVDKVLSPSEIIDLQRVTNEFVEKSGEYNDHTDIFDLEPGHSKEHPKLRRIKDPIDHHDVYARTIRHNGFLDIVGQLIGQGIRTNGNKLNMKSADFGSPVEWHQDWAFYPHTNDDVLAVGVCIDDMSEANGALLVIPGSHKGPTYDHHQDGHFCGAVTDPDFTPDNIVPLEVQAGGISIHHVRTLHASAPNYSGAPRRLLLFQFCAVDAWPLLGFANGLNTDESNWDAYNKALLRGEPTDVPRIVKTPVRMPYPQAVKGGSIYENQSVLETKSWAR